MDKQRRKELREEFEQIKTYMGVYKITNTVNGKIFIGSSPNLKNRWTTIKWQLDMGMHVNSQGYNRIGMSWAKEPLSMKFWRKKMLINLLMQDGK